MCLCVANQWNELWNESVNSWNALRPVWALMILTRLDNFFLQPCSESHESQADFQADRAVGHPEQLGAERKFSKTPV